MNKKEWSFRKGSRIKADPTVTGEYLESLEAKHAGGITPKILLVDARKKKSPLHDEFEWDDTVAAELHREEQARYILRHIEVMLVLAPKDSLPVRAFAHVETAGAPGYVNIEAVLSTLDYRDQILDQALSELRSFRRKYADLKELAEVFAALDAIAV